MGSNGRTWTQAEDAQLRLKFSDVRNQELVELLNRTERSIASRAHALGLKKSREHLYKNGIRAGTASARRRKEQQ